MNRVTLTLFRQYRTAADYAMADTEVLAQVIRPTGFYQQKTRSIQQCCAALVRDYAGVVPSSMEALICLPGVGRKTANVVLGNALHCPQGIAVDTHVKRLAQRLGLTTATSAEAIEQDLLSFIPHSAWTSISHVLIAHGRTVCKARAPQCHRCPVSSLCPSSRQ